METTRLLAAIVEARLIADQKRLLTERAERGEPEARFVALALAKRKPSTRRWTERLE